MPGSRSLGAPRVGTEAHRQMGHGTCGSPSLFMYATREMPRAIVPSGRTASHAFEELGWLSGDGCGKTWGFEIERRDGGEMAAHLVPDDSFAGSRMRP